MLVSRPWELIGEMRLNMPQDIRLIREAEHFIYIGESRLFQVWLFYLTLASENQFLYVLSGT